MIKNSIPILLAGFLAVAVLPTQAEIISFDRLPPHILDITPPADRVSGSPGNMRIKDRACRSTPSQSIRSQIVNTVVQEWAFFGFSVDDRTAERNTIPISRRFRRRGPRISPELAAKVAHSIGGYWAAAPDSGWILQRQNSRWNAVGIDSRWRHPWSAAFISWVMCENGFGDASQFERSVAHHDYIDQAIIAREKNDSTAAFMAYDLGEISISPGDLLCRGSRPAYKTIAGRRQQLNVGARTHCDVVVKLDSENQRIMVIGGNVRGSVRMKLLPASGIDDKSLVPVPYRGRTMFAHLKLKADSIAAMGLEQSPTFQAMICDGIMAPSSIEDIVNLPFVSEVDCSV